VFSVATAGLLLVCTPHIQEDITLVLLCELQRLELQRLWARPLAVLDTVRSDVKLVNAFGLSSGGASRCILQHAWPSGQQQSAIRCCSACGIMAMAHRGWKGLEGSPCSAPTRAGSAGPLAAVKAESMSPDPHHGSL
jgi:hypothetical protein